MNTETDPIETLMQLLERLMKTRNEIEEEKFYSNYREVIRLQNEVYEPSRNEFKRILRKLLDDKN